MPRVFLSLGSNAGQRKANLNKAIRLLESMPCKIIHVSSRYETEPWGSLQQQNFYNQVVEITTALNPFLLLNKLQEIERKCGRIPSTEHYAPRTLDVDILFYDDRIISAENLKIPHPLLPARKFVLIPLVEIAPELNHPVLGKSMVQLLDTCKDDKRVLRIR
jgi:2-amino-4-hydroxy-6-hydroxymethyldihydropteridine diphosphokinase